MKLVGLMPVRNEAWILGLSLRVAMTWCDEVIVLDHDSTDRTPEILREIADESGRLVVLNESGVWAEMAHRQRLLETARTRGATHCAIVDADEVLTGNIGPSIRRSIKHLHNGETLEIAMPCMWRSLTQYRKDGSVWSGRYVTAAFAVGPRLCWQAENGYDYHHREPYNSRPAQRLLPDGGVMHLQWVYWRRLLAKQALYKMLETVRYPGRRTPYQINVYYGHAVNEANMRLVDAPESWWAPYRQWLPHVDLAHEPWQEAECKRLWAEHGAQKFKGLDLFGVVQ